MSSIRVSGNTSGHYDLTVPDVAGSNTIALDKIVVTDSSGNVGIGTDAPKADFHVVGADDNNLIVQNSTYQNSGQNTEAAIRFKVTASSDDERAKAGILLKNDGSAYGRGDLHFLVDSNDDNGNAVLADSKMVISHEGNVGVGTTSPETKLDIRSATATYLTVGNTTDNTSGLDTGIVFKQIGNIGNPATIQVIGNLSPTSSSAYTAGFKFQTGDWNGSAFSSVDAMTIAASGNVGIGTTNPSSPLHVSAAKNDGWLAQLINTGTGGDANGLDIHAGVDSSDYILRTREQDGTDVMAVKYGGKVGIGTTQPAGRLHVLGSGGVDSTIQLESTGTGNTVFYMKGAAGNDFWGMFTGAIGGGLTLKDETNAKDAFNARPQGKMAYPNQTRFSAYSNNSSTSYSAGSPFIMNLVRNNINGRYNTSNGIFTADVAGIYGFRFNAYSYASGQWSVLYWNGSSISYYYDTNGTTSAGDHTVLCSVEANRIHHMAWTMYLASGTGCAVGWRSGYSGNIYRSHAQFSGELISAD